MNLHSIAVEVAESERLDSYLSQNIEEISRSQIQKLIQQGLVQINDCVCTEKKTVVKLGDRLILEIPEIENPCE